MSHLRNLGYINLVDPSFQPEKNMFPLVFPSSISMRVIKRLKNQSLSKKGSKGLNYTFKKTLIVSQKAMVDSLLNPESGMGLLVRFFILAQ